MAGQSIQDRMIAAKHSISGQGLAKSVCKATTEEVMGPKKKHLDYLIQCTHEPNVSIPQLANLLIERTQTTNWIVVFKSLISLHNLMNYGNERFTQYLASNNCTLSLSGFTDKTGAQGYDMSIYVRRYAKYLNEKAFTYRTMAFDFCKVKRGKQDGLLRSMSADKLLKTLPSLQKLLDTLVEFDVTANELTNGVVNAAFMLLFKDLIRLFACYNDGIINLLEKYFDMPKKQCREALEIYKRFLARMERCAEFLKVAENVGIDKGDIPDLATAPSSLLEALEEHLKALEGTKKSKSGDSSHVAAAGAGGKTTPQLQSPGSPSSTLSDDEKRKIIEEESKQLERYEQVVKKVEMNDAQAMMPPPVPLKESLNLLNPAPEQQASAAKPSDALSDLLGMGLEAPATFGPGSTSFDSNSMFMQQSAPIQQSMPQMQQNMPQQQSMAPMQGMPQMQQGMPQMQQGMPQMQQGMPPMQQMPQMQQAAPMQMNQFGMAGNSMQMPNVTPWPATGPPGFNFGGGMLQPQNSQGMMGNDFMMTQQAPAPNYQSNEKLIKSDIDSSLASLAGNLSVGATGKIKSDQQWGKPVEKRMTGGSTWQNPTMLPSTMAPMAPMGQQPMMGGAQGMQPMFGAPQAMGNPNAMYSQPNNHTAQPPPQQQQPTIQDPFGAL